MVLCREKQEKLLRTLRSYTGSRVWIFAKPNMIWQKGGCFNGIYAE